MGFGERRWRATVHDSVQCRGQSPHLIRTSGSASPRRHRLHHRDRDRGYDFFLYSTVTGLVFAFAKLFFPHSDPWVGTLEAFAIYAVGFVARPIGAAIFGHYGDRIGDKSPLIATLLLMGLATFAVALVPTYESIGIWGAVILTVLRFIQGVGVGGEWGGSVLMSMEWARTHRSRGLVPSWSSLRVHCGLCLANLAVLAYSQKSGEQFLAWVLRSPFGLSIVLAGVGLYI